MSVLYSICLSRPVSVPVYFVWSCFCPCICDVSCELSMETQGSVHWCCGKLWLAESWTMGLHAWLTWCAVMMWHSCFTPTWSRSSGNLDIILNLNVHTHYWVLVYMPDSLMLLHPSPTMVACLLACVLARLTWVYLQWWRILTWVNL